MPRFTLRSVAFGATVSVLSIGAFASTASAANTEPIYGSGSSLQKVLQQTVTGPAFGAVTYTSTSSGSGLNEFGSNTSVFAPSNDTVANALGRLDDFVGTDDAPTTVQLAAAKTAGGGSANELTVPVAQAPVAILLSLPAGITVSSTADIRVSQAVLQSLYHGDYATYTAFLTAAGISFTGTSTDVPKLQVRVGDSGTTRAVKSFLSQINGTNWTFGDGGDTWPTAQATTNGGANSGGGALVTSTLNTPGSVGYANLADSTGSFTNRAVTTSAGGTSHQVVRVTLQRSGPNYADASSDPASQATAAGNCALTATAWSPATGVPATNAITTWSSVAASSTSAAAYPLCAPTFDLGWDDYSAVTGTGTSPYTLVRATATGDYLKYIVSDAGQATVNANGYNRLPNVAPSGGDSIQTKAVALAGKAIW